MISLAICTLNVEIEIIEHVTREMLRPIQSQSVNHCLSLVFITVCAWITSVYTSAACGSSNYRAVSLQTSSKNMPLYNQSISSYLDIRSASMNM